MALNILMLCTKFPWPPKDGGAIAMLNMVRAFHKAGHKVTVLSMNTPKHYIFLRNLPEDIQELAEFYAVDVDTKVKVLDMLANFLFSKESYHVKRFTSQHFREELLKVLNRHKFDVVQLETLYMAPYISTIRQQAPKALIALRAHNIEHEIWWRRANNEYNPFKKYLFAETAVRIRTYEEEVIGGNQYDILVPITGRDSGMLKSMGAASPMYVCPVGMDLDALQPAPDVEMEYPSVFYIGALDWEPNREGLDWFLKEVWPIVHGTFPEVRLYLAGRNMPGKYLALDKQNIVPLGEVPSARDFIQSKAVMVVPILSGSGMRVKIVEGMAYGKAVVATHMAAEGLGAYHTNHIMLADSPADFADRVNILLEQRALYDTIADHAKSFVRRKFNNDKLMAGLISFYQKQIKAREEKEKKEKE